MDYMYRCAGKTRSGERCHLPVKNRFSCKRDYCHHHASQDVQDFADVDIFIYDKYNERHDIKPVMSSTELGTYYVYIRHYNIEDIEFIFNKIETVVRSAVIYNKRREEKFFIPTQRLVIKTGEESIIKQIAGLNRARGKGKVKIIRRIRADISSLYHYGKTVVSFEKI